MIGVGTSLFLIVMITFDNYDHFFCSGLRIGSPSTDESRPNRLGNPDKVKDMQLQTGPRMRSTYVVGMWWNAVISNLGKSTDLGPLEPKAGMSDGPVMTPSRTCIGSRRLLHYRDSQTILFSGNRSRVYKKSRSECCWLRAIIWKLGFDLKKIDDVNKSCWNWTIVPERGNTYKVTRENVFK